jgi:glycosyl transferase family 25
LHRRNFNINFSHMTSVHIVVISLKDSRDRQARVAAEMAKTPFAWEFLEAVDGRVLDLSSVPYAGAKVRRLLGFELTPKEIGCYLSHMAAWRACVAKDVPTLVFEDDFQIEPHFATVLETLVNSPVHWEIVRLQALCACSHQDMEVFQDFKLVRNGSDPLGATAYLVNPSSAQRLLDASKEIYEPLDHYIEHYEKHGLTMLAVIPYPVTVTDPTRQTSTITDRPDRQPTRGMRKLGRSLYRMLDRMTSRNPWFPR